jgi:hypothetical protein
MQETKKGTIIKGTGKAIVSGKVRSLRTRPFLRKKKAADAKKALSKVDLSTLMEKR